MKLLTAKGWTVEEEALLGTMPDQELAERLGRSGSAVSQRRQLRRRLLRPVRRRWTATEDALVRALSPAEAARQTGRTLRAVYLRRCALALPGADIRGMRDEG
jgi:hypothetical protein